MKFSGLKIWRREGVATRTTRLSGVLGILLPPGRAAVVLSIGYPHEMPANLLAEWIPNVQARGY